MRRDLAKNRIGWTLATFLGSLGLVAATPSLGAGVRIHAFAGDGTSGYGGDHGPATAAELKLPSQVAPLPNGGYLIADKKNWRIRKVAKNGTITTVAGNGTQGYNADGIKATHAQLSFPTGVAPLPHGGFLIADSGNDRIRKVNSKGIISTIAGNGSGGYNGDGIKATHAELSYPARVAPLPHGAFLVTDFSNNRVRKVNRHGIIHTVAGDGTAASGGDGGPATHAQIYGPSTAMPAAEGGILISEFGALSDGINVSRIREVNKHGTIHTVAGIGTEGFGGDGGPATSATLNHPASADPLPNGGFLIADYENNRIRKVSPSGKITTVAGNGTAGFTGNGGPPRQAEIDHPVDAVPIGHGGFLIADFFNDCIRVVR